MHYFIESVEQHWQVNIDSIPVLEMKKLSLREGK